MRRRKIRRHLSWSTWANWHSAGWPLCWGGWGRPSGTL
nr:MAG TPA: hypothetical protein [Caudoviricetes sp.]